MATARFSGLSYIFYDSDGSTTYPLGFGFLDSSHVRVYVDGDLKLSGDYYNIVNGSCVFLTAPANGSELRMIRRTPREFQDREVDFKSWGSITETQMDRNQLQIWYLIQEAIETDDTGTVNPEAEYLSWNNATSQWDGIRLSGVRPIGNIASPTSSDQVATKGYVDDIAEFGATGMPQSWSFETVASTNSYTLSGGSYLDARYLIVSIEGIIQIPNVDFTITGGDPNSSIVFETIPTVGQTVAVQNFGKTRFLNSLVLGANTIATVALQNGSVTTEKIADSAVTSGKLATASVGATKLAAGAVGTAALTDESVTFNKLKEVGFVTAPGGSRDYYLKVDPNTGNLRVDLAEVDDLSDWATEIGNIRLSQLAAPNASVSMGSQRITSLADPTALQDAATKTYVDGLVGAGSDSKIVQLYDVTFGAASQTMDFIPTSNPAWFQDSTYLYYQVVVSNFGWVGGGSIWFNFYQSGAWREEFRVTGLDRAPTDYRYAWSFMVTNPRDPATYPTAFSQSGLSTERSVTSAHLVGAATGMRIRADSTNIAADCRFQIYGHKANV